MRAAGRIAMLLAGGALLAACGGGGGGGGGGGPPPASLAITTGVLPAGTTGVAYNQTITASGGNGARNFTVSSGMLPAGLALTAATGVISGTPTAVGTSNFTIAVSDSSAPPQNASRALSITVNAAAVGRNDSIATATPLGNGNFLASISPSGHPNTVFAPDQDYYRVTTTATSTVTFDINAQVDGSPMDSVIEVLGANGIRLNTCVAPAFNSPCVHDDEVLGDVLDSFLQVRVTGATTMYLHVVEWRGDARPDLTYRINVSGIN